MKKLLLSILSALTLSAESVPFVGFIEGFNMGGYIELTKNNRFIYHECGGTMGCYSLPEYNLEYKEITCLDGECYKITKTDLALLTTNHELVKECDDEGYMYGGEKLDCIKKIEVGPSPYKN
jgi:hypothetical protein